MSFSWLAGSALVKQSPAVGFSFCGAQWRHTVKEPEIFTEHCPSGYCANLAFSDVTSIAEKERWCTIPLLGRPWLRRKTMKVQFLVQTQLEQYGRLKNRDEQN